MMKCVLALAMPLLVLWFLLAPALLTLLSQPVLTPPPDCPSMCGDVRIPYPFVIDEDCARQAILCAIVVWVVLLWFVRREHKARQRRGFFDRNGGQILKSMSINLIPKAQLDKITKNYSTRIGGGNFGEVFSGINDDNQRVAVKKLKRSIKVDEEAREKDYFVAEIIIQSQISHPNLVRLLGCCLDTEVPMLVFEFVPNGSLYDALHARGATRRITLSLPERLDIAIGSAEALAYMHSQHASHKILHGDVKSGNILLDDYFQPKVSDFGLSKLLSSTDKKYAGFVAGDIGYMDPVYMQTGLLTEKSDVYSFGIVLLELITGKEVRYNGNNSLPLDFKKSYETGTNRAREMLDETFTSVVDIDRLEKVGGLARLWFNVSRNMWMKDPPWHKSWNILS